MSVSVSSFVLFVTCTVPTTSWSGVISNLWVGTGIGSSGTTGAGGGSGAFFSDLHGPLSREQDASSALDSRSAPTARIDMAGFMQLIMPRESREPTYPDRPHRTQASCHGRGRRGHPGGV